MADYDASQTGSNPADTGPVARPDVDALPAGSFGPASGNAITGAGTVTGSAGVDTPGAAPASIVEVHGAGGAASGNGGNFQAAGQYGVLSMDAQGNFNYVRNPGTPDGVRDVFGYTLADAQGASASSTLTIDISQVATAANAGIVNLPAGVDLSDIHVSGRDLVIDMPDGTHMVIPGGAVFVPQLVIGDVAVPPSNVAALLIDSEPQPAAGPLQSSGGNFATDVPPLDPGVPLGDLIPPTELSYTPPEFRPEGGFIDHKPTVIIETPDNPAGAIDATESVNEKGLPTRNGGEPAGSGEIADGNGSNNSDGSETNGGTIVYSAADGLDNITINGVAVTTVGQTIQGQFGILTITGIADGTISYSYTLSDNTSGDATQDLFNVVVTDRDGDTATGSLTVRIADDVPTARNDTDTTDVHTGLATGNVMTGADTTSGTAGADTTGADNAHVTGVTGHGGSDTTVDTSGNLQVAGEFGTLTLNADGTYTYVLNENAQGGSVDVFTYTLTDGDGDTSTATLTITNPDHTPTVIIETPDNPAGAVNASESVDEKGLPERNGGEPAGSGEIADHNGTNNSDKSEANTGTIVFSAQDGLDSVKVNNVAVTTVGQVIHGTFGDMTITGIDLAHGQITYSYTLADNTAGNNTQDVFSVTVTDSDGDTATGSLTVHIVDDVPTANNDTDALVGNDTTTDGNVITGTGTTSGIAGADVVGADNAHITAVTGAGGTDTSFNEDGNLVIHGQFGTLEIDADGNYTYTRDPNANSGGVDTFTYTLTDGDGDPSTATLKITVPNVDSTPQIGTAENLSVDEDGLPAGNSDNGQSNPTEADHGGNKTDSGQVVVDFGNDRPATPANAVQFVNASALNGQLTQDGQPITFSIDGSGHLIGQVNGTGPAVVTIAISSATNGTGGTVTYGYTVTLAGPVDQAHGDQTEAGITLTGVQFQVTDADGDHAAAPGSFNVTIYDDVPSAEDVTVTQSSENAPVTVSLAGHYTPGADGVDLHDVTYNVTSGNPAHLGYDGNTGQFTYTPSAGEEGDVVFNYTITDADGDHITKTITIHLTPDSVPQIGAAPTLTVDEDGLPAGNSDNGQSNPTEADHGGNVTDSNTFNVDYGSDRPADPGAAIEFVNANALNGQLTQDGQPITFTIDGSGHLIGQVNGTGPAVITIALTTAVNGSGGNVTYGYSVTLAGPVDQAHGDQTEAGIPLTGVQFQVTDADGDHAAAPGSFNVTIYDDVPSAEDVTVTQTTEDQPVTVGLAGHYTPGADGVDLHDVTYNVTSGNPAHLSYDGNTGQFTYTPTAGETGDVVFNYTITDADGDHVTKTITIHLDSDSVPQIGTAENLSVDEDGLPAGNSDNGQSNPTEANHGGNVTDSGQVVVDFGNDRPATPANAIEFVNASALNGQLTQDGQPITFTIDGSGNLIGQVNGTGPAVVTISFTSATNGSGGNVTYGYEVTLAGPVDQAHGDQSEAGIMLTGVQFQVTDSDGDHAPSPGSFNVTIYDDVPSAEDVTVTQTTEDQPVTVNISTHITPGADGVDLHDVTHSAVSGGAGTLSYDGNTGVFTYTPTAGETGDVSFTYTVIDTDGDHITKTVTIHLAPDSVPQIGTVNNLSVDEDGLPGANSDNGQSNPTEANHGGNLTDSNTFNVDFGNDRPATPANAVQFVNASALNGQLTQDGQPITFSIDGSGHLIGQVNGTGPAVVTIAISSATNGTGGTVTYGYTVTLAGPVDQAHGDQTEAGITLTGVQFQVTDADGDHAAAPGSFNVTIYDDVPSAEDVGATQSGEDQPVTVNISTHITPGADGVDLHDVTHGAVSGGTGTLSYDGNTGIFTYTPTAGETGDVSFTYTVTDADGDHITKTVTIHLGPDSVPQVGTIANASVDEDGLPGANSDNGQSNPTEANHGGNLTDSHTFNVDFGNDRPATPASAIGFTNASSLNGQLTQNGQPITFSIDGSGHLIGQVNGTGPAVVTVAITSAVNGSGGNVTYGYTVTLAGHVDQANADQTENGVTLNGVQIQVTDSDGSTGSGSFNVAIYDDVPSVGVTGATTVVEGATANGTWTEVVGADTPGTTVVVFNGTEYALGTAINTGVGTLTVNANGTWTFASNNNLVNPQSVSFDVKVTDSDGDHMSGTQTIQINDGADPGPGGTVNLTLVEAALDTTKGGSDLAAGIAMGTNPSAITETQVVAPAGGLSFTAGSDNLSSVAFAASQAGITVTGLTSGYSLTWSIDGSGQLVGTLHGPGNTNLGTAVIVALTGSTGSTAAGGTAHVGVTATLVGPLSDTGTQVTINGIDVVATQTDNDTSHGTVNITVTDDTPIAGNDGNLATLDDNASGVNIGTVAALLSNDNYGADGQAASGAIVIGTGSLGGTVTINGSGQLIYTSNHNTTPGQSDIETFTYTIKDGDGDTTTATFTVTLTDTAPGPGGTVNLTLVEAALDTTKDSNDLAAGTSTGTNPSATTESQVVSPASGLSFAAGASDGLSSVAFAASQAGINVTGLTAGYSITWSINGSGQLVGTLMHGATNLGTAILVALTGNTGSTAAGGTAHVGVTATLVGPLEHSGSSISINGIDVVATQTDNDTSHGTVNITVSDDVPTLGTIQPIISDNNPTNPDGTGTLHLNSGADKFGSVVITPDLTGITAGGGQHLIGHQVGNVYTAYIDANHNGTYEAGTDTSAVFTITVDPAAGGGQGQYAFDLLQPLDGTPVKTLLGTGTSYGVGPSSSVIISQGSTNLALVTGYQVTGSFNPANWEAGTPVPGSQLTAHSVNGSSEGWGVDNNNFDAGEFMRFDFGAVNDYDGAGPGGPPTTPAGYTAPNVSYAKFNLVHYGSSDHIIFVVHDTNGGHNTVEVTGASANVTLTASSGNIAWIDVYTPDASPGKLDLTEIGVISTHTDTTIPVQMTFTDGDGDSVTGSTTIHVVDGGTATTPAALVQQASLNTSSSTSTLITSNDNHRTFEDHRAFNTAALIGAIAGAGLTSAQQLSAQALHGPNMFHGTHSGPIMAPQVVSTAQTAVRDAPQQSGSAQPSHVAGSDQVMATAHLLPADGAKLSGVAGHDQAGHQTVTQLLAGTESHAAAPGHGPMMAPTIAIPSAEMLAAHTGGGTAKGALDAVHNAATGVHSNAVVGKVLADSLAGGHAHGADIDALLHNVATRGHEAAQDALAALASHGPAGVSNGHSGVFAGFHGAPVMEHFTMHQDAMPVHT